MANSPQRSNELSAGRLALVATFVVGAGAFMGYGFVKMREGREAKVEAPAAEPEPAAAASDVVARARQARAVLDTTALRRLEPELATAQVPEAKSERVAVLATLALESSVRGSVASDPGATAQASRYVAQARPLVEQLAPELDPGFVLATRARLDLASGEDVLARHPAVLLPGFRDRELQNLLLAEPLWKPGDGLALDPPARESLARALEATPEPTALERLMLALALPAQDRAKALTRDILEAVPSQPLAQAVLTNLESAPTIAVADLPPTEAQPAEAQPAEPQPAQPAEPQPTEAQPAEAQPAEPQPAEPQPAEPQPSTSGSTKKGTPSQPKPKPAAKPATDLAEEGCKLVHGGKAEQGFAMLQRAFDQDPRDTKVTLCMAEAHMKLNRMPSARAMVERVLRSSSKNKKALQLAAKIEDELGNERSAADYYRKLLELDPDNATAKSYVEKHGG